MFIKGCTSVITALLIVLPVSSFCQDLEKQTQFILSQSLPSELQSNLYDIDFYDTFRFHADLNPFYLRGDFNGDQQIDYAIAVQRKKSREYGILVFFSTNDYQLIGAGEKLSNKAGSNNFRWMDAWHVYTKSEVDVGVGETKKLSLNTDAIMAIKTEAASGLIYWNGEEFLWYQQGD